MSAGERFVGGLPVAPATRAAAIDHRCSPPVTVCVAPAPGAGGGAAGAGGMNGTTGGSAVRGTSGAVVGGGEVVPVGGTVGADGESTACPVRTPDGGSEGTLAGSR